MTLPGVSFSTREKGNGNENKILEVQKNPPPERKPMAEPRRVVETARRILTALLVGARPVPKKTEPKLRQQNLRTVALADGLEPFVPR
jgi:hypothetical protein